MKKNSALMVLAMFLGLAAGCIDDNGDFSVVNSTLACQQECSMKGGGLCVKGKQPSTKIHPGTTEPGLICCPNGGGQSACIGDREIAFQVEAGGNTTPPDMTPPATDLIDTACSTLGTTTLNYDGKQLICLPRHGQKVERNAGPPCHTTGQINAASCRQDMSKGGFWKPTTVVALTAWVGNQDEWSKYQGLNGKFQPGNRFANFPAGEWVLSDASEYKADAPWAANNPLRILGYQFGSLQADTVCEQASSCSWVN